MDMIFQGAIFFGICLTGDYISAALPFPFPGSVIAIIILFVLLMTKSVTTEKISSISTFLLENMAFCFIPPTVAIVDYFHIIEDVWLQFIFICCITTVLTFFATAYTVKGTMHLINKGGERNF